METLEKTSSGRELDITKIGHLPTIPRIFERVCLVTNNANSSIADMTKAIEIDQAIAAKALQIANSAAFGLYSRVSSLHHACALLGMRMVKNIVLHTSLISHYEKLRRLPEFDLDHFWRHTMLVAALSRALAKRATLIPGFTNEDAYTAGLLHDIGVLVLVDNRTKQYIEALHRAQEKGISNWEAELEVFGFDHTHVGSLLAEYWKFPEEICAGIRGHHAPPAGDPKESVALLVSTANTLIHATENGKVSADSLGIDSRFFDLLKITPEQTAEAILEISRLSENKMM